MKPILYEIRRVVTSKSTLVVLMLMIVIPALIAVSAASGNSTSSVFVNSEAYGWGSNGTYNVSVLLYNNYGSPVSGTEVTYFVGQSNTTVATNSFGFANTTLRGVMNQTAQGIEYSYQSSASTGFPGGPIPVQIFQNQTDPYFTNTTVHLYNSGGTNTTYSYSRYSFNTINVQSAPSINGLILLYNAAEISSGPPVYLYYRGLSNTSNQFMGTGTIMYKDGKLPKSPPGFPGQYNESQMTLYAAYQSSPLITIVPYNLTAHTNTTAYTFELFSANGTELAWIETQLVNTFSQNAVSQLFFTSDLPLLTIFVPLMATVSAYQTFGKDRASGALASVVVRPISRRALITSRFASNVISVMIASAAALGISSLIYAHYLGIYIPAGTFALALWSLLVMTGAFVGIVYLASTFLKSSGQIMGIAIGLYLVLDVFWVYPLPLIPLLISSFVIREPAGTLGYAASLIKLYYISPAGFTSLTDYLSSSSVNGIFYMGGTYSASQLGVTLLSVVAAGLAWIALPFVLALLRFIRHD